MPLFDLLRGTPRVLDAGGAAICEYVPYLVTDLPWRTLASFDAEFRAAETHAEMRLCVDALIEERWGDRQRLVANVTRDVEGLGYALPSEPSPSRCCFRR